MNFVQNTGNLLKSLLQKTGGNIERGWETVSSYLGTPQRDVTSDYLLSPVPKDKLLSTVTAPKPPQATFDRTSYYLPTGGLTSTGTSPVSGYTAAISRELLGDIPMGTLIELPDGRVVRVEDLTSRDIKNTLDLFYNTQEEASYPTNGLIRGQDYNIIGRDTTGLKYNF